MSKYKKITNDQWEGLQFELSELKSQMAQAMEILGIEMTEVLEEMDVVPPKKPRGGLGSGPRNLSEISNDYLLTAYRDAEKQSEDWGMDTKWQDREPQQVIIVGGPDTMSFGPFVLTTPEERTLILKNWAKKKKKLESKYTEQEYLVKKIRELETSLIEERQKQADLLFDIREADRNIEQLVNELERLQYSFEKKSAVLDQAQGELAFLKSQPRRSQPPPESGVADWSRMVEEGPEA